MSKGPHPRALDLQIWAGKLERNLLAPEEAQYIAMLLRRLAAGESLDEVLGAKREAHRPNQNATRHYVEQIHGLMQSSYDGKPGLSVTEAIRKMAEVSGKSVDTVRTAFYSEAGRVHLLAVKAALKDPLA
jgi:hypothetical protein